MIPALVLTAGLGTRLDPLTRLVAKAAVPLGGSTLIERVLADLAAQSVTDVVLNLHHLPSTITAVVGDGSHLGLRVRYSWEPRLLGSAGGPRRALPLLDSDPFLILNGDTLTDVPIARLVAAHQASRAEVTMAVVPNPAPERYGGLALGPDDAVVDVVPRGRADGWHFVGVQVVCRSVFADLADDRPAESVAGVYRDLMATAGRIRAWKTTGRFLDIGTPRDYLNTALALAGGAPPDGLDRGRIDATPHVRDSVVWPDATVERGARLTGCIVAGPVTVPEDFQAHARIIVPASIVRSGESVERRGDLALFPFAG